MLKTQCLLLCFILVLVSANLFGQHLEAVNKKSGESIFFDLTESDPAKVNNLYVGVEVLGIELQQGFFMGFALDANYYLKNKLHFKVNSFRPFFDGTDSERGSYYRNEEDRGIKLRLYNKTEAGIAYYFLTFKNERKAKVVIKEELLDTQPKTREVTIFKTRIPNHTKLGLRGGYHYYHQSSGGELDLIIDTTALGNPVHVSSFTNHLAYVGFSSTSFQNFRIDSEEYAKSSKSRINTFYLDLLLGLGGQSDFIAYDEDREGTYPYDSDLEFAIQKSGFRVGWEKMTKHSKIDKFGGKLAAEIGVRPILDFPVLDEDLVPTGRVVTRFFFAFKYGFLFTDRI